MWTTEYRLALAIFMWKDWMQQPEKLKETTGWIGVNTEDPGAESIRMAKQAGVFAEYKALLSRVPLLGITVENLDREVFPTKRKRGHFGDDPQAIADLRARSRKVA